jgi:tetratricopeptide (TPR) repeat protein
VRESWIKPTNWWARVGKMEIIKPFASHLIVSDRAKGCFETGEHIEKHSVRKLNPSHPLEHANAMRQSLPALTSAWLLIGATAVLGLKNPPAGQTQSQPNPQAAIVITQGMEKLTAGRPEEAMLDAQRAIGLDSTSANAYFLRARAEDDIGLKADALKDYDKAIGLNPKFAKAYSNRALIKAGQGNLKGAMADMDTAIALDPKLAAAYVNRGVAHGAMGNRKAAINDFSKAISLNPKHENAYRNRGITREMNGDIKGACADWKMAAALGQKDAATWYQNQCSK